MRITTITIVSFGIYYLLDDLYFIETKAWLDEFIEYIGISHLLSYILYGLLIFVGAVLIHGRSKVLQSLGFNRSIITALAFSFICTLPMFLGFIWKFIFNNDITLNHILISW